MNRSHVRYCGDAKIRLRFRGGLMFARFALPGHVLRTRGRLQLGENVALQSESVVDMIAGLAFEVNTHCSEGGSLLLQCGAYNAQGKPIIVRGLVR